MKLYTYPQNKNAYKALIAAQYVGAKIEVPAFKMGVDNKTEQFLKKNPFGKVPCRLLYPPPALASMGNSPWIILAGTHPGDPSRQCV